MTHLIALLLECLHPALQGSNALMQPVSGFSVKAPLWHGCLLSVGQLLAQLGNGCLGSFSLGLGGCKRGRGCLWYSSTTKQCRDTTVWYIASCVSARTSSSADMDVILASARACCCCTATT